MSLNVYISIETLKRTANLLTHECNCDIGTSELVQKLSGGGGFDGGWCYLEAVWITYQVIYFARELKNLQQKYMSEGILLMSSMKSD